MYCLTVVALNHFETSTVFCLYPAGSLQTRCCNPLYQHSDHSVQYTNTTMRGLSEGMVIDSALLDCARVTKSRNFEAMCRDLRLLVRLIPRTQAAPYRLEFGEVTALSLRLLANGVSRQDGYFQLRQCLK